jgi:hypothetical protein
MALGIDIITLPPAFVGEPFSVQFTTNFNGAPIPQTDQVWSILAGSLPDGLILNQTSGEISGIPTEQGIFPFLLFVVNNNIGDSAGAEVNIAVNTMGPFLIDTDTFGKYQAATPRVYDDKVFLVWFDQGSGNLKIWKSIDNGYTFSSILQGTLPTPVVSGTVSDTILNSTTLRVVWQDVSDMVHLGDFDMNLETWTPLSVALDLSSTFRHPTGIYIVNSQTWVQIEQNPANVYIYIFNGLTWGSAIFIDTNMPVGPLGATSGRSAITPDGDYILVYGWATGTFFSPTWHYYYRKLHKDGVTLDPPVWFHDESNLPGLGLGRIGFVGGKGILAYRKPTIVDPFLFTGEFFWFNYTLLAPSFTSVPLPTQLIGEINCSPIGSELWIYWIDIFELVTYASLDRLVYVTYDGTTVSEPTVLNDQILTPSFPDVPTQFLHEVSTMYVLPNGNIGFQMALEYTPPGSGTQLCVGFFWQVGPSAVPPLPPPPAPKAVACFHDLTKNPADVIEETITWSGWLAGDAISSSSWASDPGITATGINFTDNSSTVQISGGTFDTDYVVSNTIGTQLGKIEVASILVKVRQCASIADPSSWMTDGSGTAEDINLSDCYHLIIKNPEDVLDITIDWSDWLEGDRISRSAWSQSTGVTVIGSTRTDLTTSASAKISGGMAGSEYWISCTIETEMGRTEVRRIVLDVEGCAPPPQIPSTWWRD